MMITSKHTDPLLAPVEQAQIETRFFVASDEEHDEIVFPLPQSWWSRPYEYPWALRFAVSDSVVLDAACGVSHPLKFALADMVREVHAVDLDPRILDRAAIYEAIEHEYGQNTDMYLTSEVMDRIKFKIGSVCALPFNSDFFDIVFCISVLEHLDDQFNRWPLLTHIPRLQRFLRHDVDRAFKEFSRVLKPHGIVVLTFDYPRINIAYLQYLIDKHGFKLIGPVDWSIPDNVVTSPDKELYCFRVALEKRCKED